MLIFILGIIIFLTCLVLPFVFEELKKHKKLMFSTGVICLVICIAFSCISGVPTGYTGIVTTFGKVHDETLDAGIHFHAPWDTVITMDNREQKVAFQLEAFSKDIQQVDVQGSLNYNIDKATAMNLYRDVGTNYPAILIGPRIQEDVKIIIAKYTAENLIENRQNAADAIYELIRDELEPKGIHIISLAMENIDFTDAFEAAVEAKQVATQDKQKAQTEQERMTMEEEAKARRAIIVANADAEQAKIAAQADLEVVKIQAEAALYAGEKEAEMNKRIAEGLTEELIHYYEIKQWNGALPTFMGGEGTLPILNFGGAE